MRYQCRLAGKPATYDVRYPGTYNARRDNLDGFWADVYGTQHGIMVVNSFYENVPLHLFEKRALGEGRKGKEPGAALQSATAAGNAGGVSVVALDAHFRSRPVFLRGRDRRSPTRGGGHGSQPVHHCHPAAERSGMALAAGSREVPPGSHLE